MIPTVQRYEDLIRGARHHWQDGRGKVLVMISAGWFLSIGVRVTYPVLLPYLRTEYALSLTAAGFLLTVLWLAYAIGQIPGGMLGDRIGEGRTMVMSTLIAAGTLIIVVTADSSAVLYASTAALGFAIALYGVVRLTVLLDIYPDQVGTAQGIVAAVGDVGNTVLPPIVGLLAAAITWRLGFGILIPLFILVGIGIYSIVPARTSSTPRDDTTINTDTTTNDTTINTDTTTTNTDTTTNTGKTTGADELESRSMDDLETAPADEHEPARSDRIRTVVRELRHPAIVFITTIQILAFAVQQAFMGFFPTYLIEVKTLSPGISNGLFALFFALGVVVKPLAGNAYDRVGARQALLAMTAAPAVGLIALPLVNEFWSLLAVTALVSAMLGRGTTTMAYMTVTLSNAVRNTGLGVLRTVFFTIGALSPLAFGAIADQGFFNEAFMLLGIVSGFTLIVIFWLPESSR